MHLETSYLQKKSYVKIKIKIFRSISKSEMCFFKNVLVKLVCGHIKLVAYLYYVATLVSFLVRLQCIF